MDEGRPHVLAITSLIEDVHLREENERLKQRVATLTEQNNGLIESLKVQLSAAKGLQDQIFTITQDNISLHSQIYGLQTDNSTLRGDITSLKEENQNLRADNSTLHGDITSLKEENQNLRADNSTLHGDITSLKEENQNLRAEISKLNSVNTHLQAQIDTLNSVNTHLQAQIDTLNRNIQKITWREAMRALENHLAKRMLGSTNQMKKLGVFTAKELLKHVNTRNLANELQTELSKLGLEQDDLSTLRLIKETGNSFVHDASVASQPTDLRLDGLEDPESCKRLVGALAKCCADASIPFGTFKW